MVFTITHEGVPIGTTELTLSEVAAGEFIALPGYAAIAPTIRAASAVLWAQGVFASEPTVVSAGAREALAQAQLMVLELRDPLGAQVPVDFVNVVERPAPDALPAVFARFRAASANASVRSVRTDRGGSAEGAFNA